MSNRTILWKCGISESHLCSLTLSIHKNLPSIGQIEVTALLSAFRALAHLGVAANLSDGQLLDRFLSGNGEPAEAAFEALVVRHGPMVLDVCGKILRDHHDAQDAFQATFLVLASKAQTIRQRDSVGGWLLVVARQVAVRLRADRARRQMYEVRAAEFRAQTERDRPEIWPELDEEISRLPVRYREPLVLCYLEGLSTDAAALRLGCPRGTVLSRLSRARERLRDRLTRRGVALSAAIPTIGAAIDSASASVPSVLLSATVRACLEFVKPKTAAVLASNTTALLAIGVIRAMTITKLTTIGVATLACAIALGGAYTYGQFGSVGGTGQAASPRPSSPDRSAVLALAQGGAKPTGKSLPTPVATQPSAVNRPGSGVIALPGPFPGTRKFLVFAIIGKLSNMVMLECESKGRIRATFSRGTGGKEKVSLEGVSVRIDGSRQAPASPNSLGDPIVESTSEGNVIVFPGPRPGEALHLQASGIVPDPSDLVISSEAGDRLRVKALAQGGYQPRCDVLCSAIRVDALYAADLTYHRDYNLPDAPLGQSGIGSVPPIVPASRP